jgi:hypothetical protein
VAEKERIAWIAAVAAAVSATVAVVAYLWPSQPAAQPASAGVGRGAASSGRAAHSDPAGGPAPSAADDRFVAEYTDTVFTMPNPGGCAQYDMETVTFTADGPSVGTNTSLNIGNGAAGDLFYTACGQGTDVVAASDESNFAKVSGHPDANACASMATQQPTRKRIVFQQLRKGAAFCLVSNFGRSQVVLVMLTGISSGRDLAWTATAWLDNGR